MRWRNSHFLLGVCLWSSLIVRPAWCEPAEDQYAVAASDYAEKRWDHAAAGFERYLTQHRSAPNQLAARFYLAESLLQLKRYADAEAHYTTVLAEDSANQFRRRALFRGAEAAYLAGHHDRARTTFREFLLHHSDDPLAAFAHYYLGQLELRERKTSAARDHLAEALRRSPEGEPRPRVELALAWALHGERQTADAAELFRRCLDRPDQRTEASFGTGLTLVAEGKWLESARALEEAAEADPHHRLAPAIRAQSGTSWLEAGRPADAIKQFRAVVEQSPDGLWADDCQLGLIKAHLAGGQADDAVRAADELEKRFPQSPHREEAQWLHSRALMLLERYAAALEILERLTLSDSQPRRIAARAELAVCLAHTHQFERARATHESLIADDGEHPAVVQATRQLARLALDSDHCEWSEGLFGWLVAHETERQRVAEGLTGLAWSRLKLGDTLRAGEVFEQLVREHADAPDLDRAIYAWAWILRDRGEDARAEGLLKQIHREHPGSRHWSDATLALAERTWEAGNLEQTERYVRAILDARNVSPDRATLARAFYLEGRLAAERRDWSQVLASMRQVVTAGAQDPSADRATDPGEKPAAVVGTDVDSSLKLAADFWFAEAQFRQGDLEKAAASFAELVRRIDGQPESWLGIIPLRRAQILAHEERWADALEIAAGVAAAYPQFDRLYEVDYVIGRCHAGLGQFDQARRHYEAVISSAVGGKSETAAMAQWMIGETYMHQKEYARAHREYLRTEILYDYPDWQARALLQAGKCLELQSQHQEALHTYRRLIERYPSSGAVDEAQHRLQLARNQMARTLETGVSQ
jgi:TolA-binding protein